MDLLPPDYIIKIKQYHTPKFMDVVEGKIELTITEELIHAKKNPISAAIDNYFGVWITHTMSKNLGIRTDYGVFKMDKFLWDWLKTWKAKKKVEPITFKLIYLHGLGEEK